MARMTTSNHDGQEMVQSGISELVFENSSFPNPM